jgi:hypothetical protein
MDFDHIVHMDVPKTLDLVGAREQLQIYLHDNGFVIIEESWVIAKIITIDIQDNPVVWNDLKTIGPMLFTTKSKVQSAPTIIGTKQSTPKNEVREVLHRM